MESPPLVVPGEEAVDSLPRVAEGARPLVEEGASFVRQLVRPLARPREVVLPFRADDPFGLQQTEEAVQVAHVHPLSDQLRELLEQLVTVSGPLPQQEQDRRLRETLDPRPDLVPAGADAAAYANRTPKPSPVPHQILTCKTHMYAY